MTTERDVTEVSLVVSEVFGPTFQGEGPSAGRLCSFVRLGRCNLDCAWCDTPYTWDWHGKNGPAQDPGALMRLSVGQVLSLLQRPYDTHAPDLFVVTGGEPLLQTRGLTALCEELTLWGRVEVETNGTLMPLAVPGVRHNVSPKLAHSGVDPLRAIAPSPMRAFAELAHEDVACFKFVARDSADLAEVQDLRDRFDIPDRAIWIMPEGRSAADIQHGLRTLAAPVLERGWNLSGRLHVTIWEDTRGV